MKPCTRFTTVLFPLLSTHAVVLSVVWGPWPCSPSFGTRFHNKILILARVSHTHTHTRYTHTHTCPFRQDRKNLRHVMDFPACTRQIASFCRHCIPFLDHQLRDREKGSLIPWMHDSNTSQISTNISVSQIRTSLHLSIILSLASLR